MKTLDELIIALCLDYGRRRDAIRDGVYERRTLMEYRYLNFRILEAALEIAGERDAELFIKEIGERTGYAKSELYRLCEVNYKRKKSDIKRAIAIKLHLID